MLQLTLIIVLLAIIPQMVLCCDLQNIAKLMVNSYDNWDWSFCQSHSLYDVDENGHFVSCVYDNKLYISVMGTKFPYNLINDFTLVKVKYNQCIKTKANLLNKVLSRDEFDNCVNFIPDVVHYGFLHVAFILLDKLKSIITLSQEVVLIGHSLGSASVRLLAPLLENLKYNIKNVYLFAEPNSMSLAACYDLSIKTKIIFTTINNQDDIVTTQTFLPRCNVKNQVNLLFKGGFMFPGVENVLTLANHDHKNYYDFLIRILSLNCWKGHTCSDLKQTYFNNDFVIKITNCQLLGL